VNGRWRRRIIVGRGNAKQKEEESHPNLKVALLEVNSLWRRKLEGIWENFQLNDASFFQANNKILEGKLETLQGKLENLELKAQILALTEEANLNKLREENKAIRARMEAAEEKATKV
jgi:hypothetical protein